METLHEEAFNDHCFDCGIELNKDNTSMWECFRRLNNTIVQAKVCNKCELAASKIFEKDKNLKELFDE